LSAEGQTVIDYRDTLDAVMPEMLRGFFVGWKAPLSPETHLEVLANADVRVLALDTDTRRVVGFVVALTDGVQQAFIYILEVLPDYQERGIGTELMRRILDRLQGIPCIDLTCDPGLQRFYARFGMRPSVGMVIRDY
jgi:ribosomal protein S18 acetylase RimI-like enzyme